MTGYLILTKFKKENCGLLLLLLN